MAGERQWYAIVDRTDNPILQAAYGEVLTVVYGRDDARRYVTNKKREGGFSLGYRKIPERKVSGVVRGIMSLFIQFDKWNMRSVARGLISPHNVSRGQYT